MSYIKPEIPNDLDVNSVTASAGFTGSFIGDGAGLYNIPTSSINNINEFATLTGVSGTFLSKDVMTAHFTSSDGDLPSVQVNIEGGVPPYTYNWSLQQGTYNTKQIISPANSSSVILINNLNNNSYVLNDSTMLKLEVTDSRNNKNTFYHTHNVVGYSPMTLNVGRSVLTGCCSDGNMRSASAPTMPPFSFFDNHDLNNTYEPLSKLSDSQNNSDYGTFIRSYNDKYMYNLVEKLLIDDGNHKRISQITGGVFKTINEETLGSINVNVNNFSEFSDLANTQIQKVSSTGLKIADVQYGMVRNSNYLLGLDIHKYTRCWNAKFITLAQDWDISGSIYYEDLGGTIKDHYGITTTGEYIELYFYTLTFNSVEELPINGYSGWLASVNGGDTYAWSWRDNSWSIPLASRINELTIKTIKDHIGDTRIRYLDRIQDVSGLPETGSPGDVIPVGNYGSSHYAWSGLESRWHIYLGTHIENIDTERRARRDMWMRCHNELKLALSPFINAGFNFPLHKIR